MFAAWDCHPMLIDNFAPNRLEKLLLFTSQVNASGPQLRAQIMGTQRTATDDNVEYIFRPYITVKGKRITRKNGGMFKIPIKKH